MTHENHLRNMVQEKLSRRGFLRGLSIAGAGAAVAATVPATIANAANGSNTFASVKAGVPFKAIEPSTADDIVLAEGFKYQTIIKRGDVFTADGKTFGDNADWTGYYPIDALEGGTSTTEGLLVVNLEYLNPLFVSGFTGEAAKTVEQINTEKGAVGFSVVHIKKTGDAWAVVTDSKFAKRFDGTTEIELTGPVAGTIPVKGKNSVVGTVGNCSGGQTPWQTGLSCEENYQSYYGEDSVKPAAADKTEYQWGIDADNAELPEAYGWVVEVDPFTGIAKKRTAMGRFRHENVAIAIGKSGKVVAYMGDDSRDECVYKFVSDAVYNPNDREANLDILAEGKLYAAEFGNAKWIEIKYEGNEAKFTAPLGNYTIRTQADVLTYTNVSARALGATRTDRPEDIEVHPLTGDVYIAFTNNSNHGNFHGQITRIQPTDGDHESETFDWDIFAVGGPQSGFSSPDNLIFDKKGNLWVVTDISSSSLNKGIFRTMGNNALFMIPTDGDNVGVAYRFAAGPVECELTGPTFLDDNTLILSVQHPGENSESLEALTSHWPEGGTAVPRAGVVAVTGPFDQIGV